jgi:cell wall-associated NlpC family hydrolase
MNLWEDLIGTPFKYGARPNDGSNALDCYGLIQEFAIRRGDRYPVRQFSEQSNVIHKLMEIQMDEWVDCEPEEGAVVLFKVNGVACHVGVMIDKFRFLHTWAGSGGVCVERLSLWSRKVVGYYKYIGVED